MDTPDLIDIDRLTDSQARMLHALYQDEWWTRGRTLELACLPERETFYERLGFTTDVGGIRLMRRSRRP